MSGFFIGVDQALQKEIQRDYQSREAQRARDDAMLARREQREYEEKMFMKKVAEDRKTNLLTMMVDRKAKEANKWSPDAINDRTYGLGLLEGNESEAAYDLAAAISTDPLAARDFREIVKDANKVARENGMPLPSVESIIETVSIYGSEGTAQDVFDSQAYRDEIMSTDFGANPDAYWDLMTRLKTDGAGGPSFAVSGGDLGMVPQDELPTKQKAIFDDLILEKVAQYEREIADGEQSVEFAEARKMLDDIGAPAFYGMFGAEVAGELMATESNIFRTVGDHPVLGKFFKANEMEAPSLEESYEPEQPFTVGPSETTAPAAPTPDVDMTTAMVMPKRVNIDGEVVELEELEEVSPEIVEEFGATYEEWREMSRSERKEAGLPVSEIGGQIRYANRDGAYDIFQDGWKYLRELGSMIGGGTDFNDDNRRSAEEKLKAYIKRNNITEPFTATLNGQKATIKP